MEDRGDAGPNALYAAVQDAMSKATQNPALAGLLSTYQINVPQLDVNVDRDKVKQQDVKLSDVFETLQIYLGSTLRERLQPLRAHLPGHGAGGRAVPLARRGHPHAARRAMPTAQWCRWARC